MLEERILPHQLKHKAIRLIDHLGQTSNSFNNESQISDFFFPTTLLARAANNISCLETRELNTTHGKDSPVQQRAIQPNAPKAPPLRDGDS